MTLSMFVKSTPFHPNRVAMMVVESVSVCYQRETQSANTCLFCGKQRLQSHNVLTTAKLMLVEMNIVLLTPGLRIGSIHMYVFSLTQRKYGSERLCNSHYF